MYVETTFKNKKGDKMIKNPNWDSIKSYKNIDNLSKALTKLGFADLSHMIIGVPSTTRVTAIFSLTELTHYHPDVRFIDIASKGFMVVN